ncbi:MAG: hypothetical protein ACI8R4_003157 [Paracoccaceae bacterium]|jgi:hypothetical protein
MTLKYRHRTTGEEYESQDNVLSFAELEEIN